MWPRQQLVVAGAVVGVFLIAFVVPVSVALLDGELLRAIGTPAGSPSIPRLVVAAVASILLIGGLGAAAGIAIYLHTRDGGSGSA